MKRGIIFEIENRTAIIMTPSGDFKKVKLNHDHYRIGDEFEEAPKALKFIKPNVIQGLALATVLLIILYIPSVNYFNRLNIYGYVNIDTNPSLELAYNESFDVVRIKALDEDGKTVIDALDNVINQPLNDVIEDVVGESYVFIGPFEPKATIVTITDIKGTMDIAKEKAYLNKALKDYRVLVLESNEATYVAAKEDRISPGKLLVFEQLGETTIKEMTVTELFERLQMMKENAENKEKTEDQTSIDDGETVEGDESENQDDITVEESPIEETPKEYTEDSEEPNVTIDTPELDKPEQKDIEEPDALSED